METAEAMRLGYHDDILRHGATRRRSIAAPSGEWKWIFFCAYCSSSAKAGLFRCAGVRKKMCSCEMKFGKIKFAWLKKMLISWSTESRFSAPNVAPSVRRKGNRSRFCSS